MFRDSLPTSGLASEVLDLKAQIDRKDALLRTRSAQLSYLEKQMNDRTMLWGNVADHHKVPEHGKEPVMVAVAVLSDFDARPLRDKLRIAWYGPNGNSTDLEQRTGVRIVFAMGNDPNRVAKSTARDEALKAEAQEHGDMMLLDRAHYSTNTASFVHALWQVFAAKHVASFYMKVQANAVFNPKNLATLIRSYNASDALYIGCFKSGNVITDQKAKWYEPHAERFGGMKLDGKMYANYILHASSTGYALSRPIAEYLSVNGAVLQAYANEDVMVGTWMLGLNVAYETTHNLCCHSPGSCDSSVKGCVLLSSSCNGVCLLEDHWEDYRACATVEQ